VWELSRTRKEPHCWRRLGGHGNVGRLASVLLTGTGSAGFPRKGVRSRVGKERWKNVATFFVGWLIFGKKTRKDH